MGVSSRLIPIGICCDVCGCCFVRSLRDIGWINSTTCPDCGELQQLETGPNANRVHDKQSAWLQAYQQAHFPQIS